MKYIKHIVLLNALSLIQFIFMQIIFSRNVHRSLDPQIGSISVRFEDSSQAYTFYDSHLREFPLFKTYNHNYLMTKQMPEKIQLTENNGFIEKQKLEDLIKQLMQEIKEKKRKFSNFKILKQRDFNYFNSTGLIILKFNDYPFVLKLFMEQPESFTRPFNKSFQVRGVFLLGGTFRHIMGYTRIRNVDLIQEKINNDPYWSKKVSVPRKWFWVPAEQKWLIINGYNLGKSPEQAIKIPSTYAVICDEIKNPEKKQDPKLMKDEYLNLCNFLEMTLDPNPQNFKLDKNNKFVLIDTEHFTTLIGLRKKIEQSHDYPSYYVRLVRKYLRDRFISPKNVRRERQKNSITEYPLFND